MVKHEQAIAERQLKVDEFREQATIRHKARGKSLKVAVKPRSKSKMELRHDRRHQLIEGRKADSRLKSVGYDDMSFGEKYQWHLENGTIESFLQANKFNNH
jgi:hypothetical protein